MVISDFYINVDDEYIDNIRQNKTANFANEDTNKLISNLSKYHKNYEETNEFEYNY